MGQAGQVFSAHQAAQNASMSYLATNLSLKGVDTTDEQQVRAYVAENPKVYQESILVGLQALGKSYAGAKIDDAILGNVAKKMDLNPFEEVGLSKVYSHASSILDSENRTAK